MADKIDEKGSWQTPEEFIAHEAARISGGKQNLRLPHNGQPTLHSDEPITERSLMLELSADWRTCPACGVPVPQAVFIEPLTWHNFFVARRRRVTKPHKPFRCPTCEASLAFRRPRDAQSPWFYSMMTAGIVWSVVLATTQKILAHELNNQVLFLFAPFFVHIAIRHHQRILTIIDGLSER